MAAIVKVTGFEDLDGKLHDLIREKGEAILRKALRTGGEIMQQAVIDAAPMRTDGRGGHNANPAWDLPPGALRSDIRLRVGKDRETGGLAATIGPGKYTRQVASWVEYGHESYRGRKRPGNKSLGFVPAHPFVRVAFETTKDAVEAAIKETIVTEVEKIMKVKG